MDGSTYFGLAGLTWPLRARSFSPQVLSRGGSYSARGYCAFFAEENLLPSLALTNSKAFDYIFKVALGRFGGASLLRTSMSLGEMRKSEHSYNNIPLIVTYHPAALLRNPQWKRQAWEDLKKIKTYL